MRFPRFFALGADAQMTTPSLLVVDKGSVSHPVVLRLREMGGQGFQQLKVPSYELDDLIATLQELKRIHDALPPAANRA